MMKKLITLLAAFILALAAVAAFAEETDLLVGDEIVGGTVPEQGRGGGVVRVCQGVL